MKRFIILHPRTFKLSCLLFVIFSFILLTPEAAAQELKEDAVNRDSVIAAAREIMGMQTYCALITLDSAGLPQIRTMNPFPPEEDMTVWMATNTRTRKANEIQNNPNVCLYYADHKQPAGYVAINGQAVLVSDKDEIQKRWRTYWDQAFPEKEYLVLIKVIPQTLNVLNYKRGILNDSITWRTPSIEFENP